MQPPADTDARDKSAGLGLGLGLGGFGRKLGAAEDGGEDGTSTVTWAQSAVSPRPSRERLHKTARGLSDAALDACGQL